MREREGGSREKERHTPKCNGPVIVKPEQCIQTRPIPTPMLKKPVQPIPTPLEQTVSNEHLHAISALDRRLLMLP